MADKNTYALSVSLDLDASAAFDTLNDFTTKVTSLEDQVSTAAQNAIKSIDKISQTLDVSLSSVVTKVDELNSSVADISRGFSEVNSIVTEIEGIDTELLEHFKELNQDLEERLKIEEKIKNIVLEQQETNEIFLKTINGITDAIKSKNLQHEAQTRHLENENVVADAVANQIGRQHRNAISLTQVLNQVISRFKQILSIISGFDKETEQFVTANYRAYNSQTVLLNQARGLSAEYGIFEEHAISAMKELMQVKAPREELVKLAQVIGYAQRVTGVSAKTWADYTKSLKSAGQAQEQIERNILMTMEAQRKYAITTAELERMHQKLSDVNDDLILYFGKDAPEKFKQASLGYAALEKQMGLAQGTGEKFVDLMKLQGVAGLTMRDALEIPQDASPEEMYNRLIPALRSYIETEDAATAAAIRAGKPLDENGAEFQVLLQDLTNLTKGQVQFNASMVRAAFESERLTDATGKGLLQFEKLGDALKSLKTPADYAAEANQAFTGASKELWATLKGLAGILLSLAAEVLIPIIKVLAWVFQIVGEVINMWYNMTLALGPFGTVLRWVVGIIVIAVLALITFIPVLTALAGLFFGLPGVVTWVASSITALAAAVGGAIVTILTSIGTGLAALGSAIQPVIGPILGLALALLLVSVAAVAFAYAVKIIAEVGWAAVPAMLGLIVAIGLLGLVLIGLAYLAMPVIPALLAIGAAIFLVGLGAVLFGFGMMLAAQACMILVQAIILLVEAITKPHSPPLYLVLPIVAAGLMVLAIAALGAAPAILIASVAFIALAVAAVIAAYALDIIYSIISNLDPEILVAFAKGVFEASLYFVGMAAAAFVAGLLLVAAAPMLIIGAAMLVVAGIALAAAGTVLAYGAILLTIASTAILISVTGLLPISMIIALVSITIFISASILAVASIAMIASAITLMVAASTLLIAGVLFIASATLIMTGAVALAGTTFALVIAGISLGIGVAALSAVTIALLTAGGMMYIGGLTLYMGAMLISKAVNEISTLVVPLMSGSWLLFLAVVKYLLPAAKAMIIVGPLFLIGATLFLMSVGVLALAGTAMAAVGAILIASGALFVAGMWLLRNGINLLIEVIEPFKKAVTDLLAVTDMLLPAAMAILLSGIYVFIGATLLGAGSAVLGVSVAALAVVAAGMWLASIAIRKGASKLEAATEPLFNAGQYVYAAGESIENGIIKLSAAANNIRSIISDFFIAASMMSAVAPALISGAIALITGSMALGMASVYVIIGAYMIMRAIPLMSVATNMLAKIGDSFKRAIETFKQPSVELLQTLGSITLAIASLNAATTSMNLQAAQLQQAFGNIATSVNTATTSLQAQAIQFQQTFGGITTSISSFTSSLQAPVEQLTTIMGQMAGVLTSFGPIGETLEADLDNLITIVDSYAAKLEGVSERIQTAVATKAIPAMRAAEEAGIEEAIKAESISTIEMIPPDKDDSADKTNELLQRQLEVLSKLADGVEKIGAGSGTEVAQILEMLQTFLPGMVAKEDGLSTQMNDWMR